MALKQKILEDLKDAMKSGDSEKRDVLRLIDSAVKNVEIEKGKREEGLGDEEVIEILSRAMKQRQDSISQYEKGGRADLAEKERAEMEIISQYMPEQLGKEELRNIVKSSIEKSKATSKSDFGKVMGMVMAQVKGKTDGNTVKDILNEELGKL